ncbi:MAG TPA: HAD family hydrolase [Sulfurimonas sp.]|nr:HAD family hydrolase [Sulfurimonas sp.]
MKIAIFDMDGTLLDSAKDITISVNAVREANHKLYALDESYVVDAINREHRNLAELFYGTPVYEDKDQELFEKYYKHQCVQNVALYEGITECLVKLKEKEVRISVATNAPTKFAKLMLEKCNILDNFDVIIGADRVTKAKPDKEMLDYILNHYGYKTEHKALMVGDNIKDMQAASHAGIEGAFATWGFSPQTKHSYRISKPEEVLDFFN